MKTSHCIIHFLLIYLLAFSATAKKDLTPNHKEHRELIEQSEEIIFLGDSITYGGNYVRNFETWLTLNYPTHTSPVINLGLASETVSGISEKGHAGGRFPRPDLHERLDRVLAKTNPDLIFACYGMNCGIQKPFDEERFQKYKDGIMKLKSKAEKSGAKIIFITPPIYDGGVNPKKAYYTDVLQNYAAWLVSQRKKGWNVIDLNTHMTKALAKKRKNNPKFTYQKDAVHPNADGHWVMTQPILSWLGDQKSADCTNVHEMVKQLDGTPELHKLVVVRSNILRNAWLTETGHKRPGVPKGMPIDQANKKAIEITKAINEISMSKQAE